MDELKQDLMDAEAKLFGKRETLSEAIDFAVALAKAEGMPEGYMTTAIMVYHNTLLALIGKGIEELQSEAKA